MQRRESSSKKRMPEVRTGANTQKKIPRDPLVEDGDTHSMAWHDDSEKRGVTLEDYFGGLGYTLKGYINEGGMGSVYEAIYVGESSVLGMDKDTRVAIKFLSPMASDEDCVRFYREAAVIQALKHPNVVKVYEAGLVGERPFFVMEYLNGTDLENIMVGEGGKQKAIEVKKTLGIIRQVCSAFSSLHSQGIIHRDIKPSNIFMMEDGSVKIIDFGVAKIVHRNSKEMQRLTQSNTVVGTPVYMAPEMIDAIGNGDVDQRVDIYSLGITMYEMLTGGVPFEGKNYMHTLQLHSREKPKPLRKKRPDLQIDRCVDRLVLKCLEKKPNDRFQSMEELMKQIDTCLQELGADVVQNPQELGSGGQPETWNSRLGARAKIGAAVAVAALVSGIYLMVSTSDKAEQESENVQRPVVQTTVEKNDVIYKAHIETDIQGVSVMKEETLESGTLVPRVLGKTPLDIDLKGENIVYLEMEGHKRAYVRITPDNNNISLQMEKR